MEGYVNEKIGIVLLILISLTGTLLGDAGKQDVNKGLGEH